MFGLVLLVVGCTSTQGGPSFGAVAVAVVAWLRDVLAYAGTPFLLSGALLALEISALSMIGGLTLGLCLAVMRLSRLRPARYVSLGYVWFMRGTPLLLQLVFLYDALPRIGIRLDSFTTAVIGFALNEAAFSAEFIRGGILSVNRNQTIAATALGMGPLLTMRRIVLPQAMRAILPGIANSTVNMIKGTSIASIIFVNELTFRSEQIVAQNFQFFTVLTAAALIYLAMTSVVTAIQAKLEAHFSPDRETAAPKAHLFGRLFAVEHGRQPASAALPSPSVAAAAHASPPEFVAAKDGSWLDRLASRSGGRATVSTETFVACRNVWKSYGGREVLRGLDLSVKRGEVVAILGPSGSGKSTLLRLINHLEHLDWGEITVGGKHVGYDRIGTALKPRRDLARCRADARIGMVFQHFNLFDHLTALDNVIEAPIRVYGEDPAQARQIGMDLLASVGLGNHAHELPHRLSGGQQQRVAIARSLAISPRLMLFDEPTSALDPELVGEVLAVIRRLANAGMTMVIVTHEVRFAREVADQIVFVDGGEIVERGTPRDIIGNPQQERTRRFLRMVDAAAPAG
jgi:polar amino acid transport system ATP-binding protein/polar amino acid transport system permease protein